MDVLPSAGEPEWIYLYITQNWQFLGIWLKKKQNQAVKEKLGVGPVQFYKKVKYMPEC